MVVVLDWTCCSHPLLTLLLLLSTCFQAELGSESCSFPPGWTGSWFLSGHRDRVLITSENLGNLGTCIHQQDENKYVLEREHCFQCLAIWQRHTNVLQFKGGECVEGDGVLDDLKTLCTISPDSPLTTLARLDGEAVSCPLQAPLSFTYRRSGGRECLSPLSQISQCLISSQLMLKFQACPDIPQTESKDEVLSCKATWPDDRDPSQTFLLASIDFRYRRTEEERVRCFLLRNITSGQLMAQSADATCHSGLQSPEDGYLMFNMTPAEARSDCEFPGWAAGRFLSFDFSTLFDISAWELATSNYSYLNRQAEQLAAVSQCVQVLEEADDWVKAVLRLVAGCESVYKCVLIRRRTDHILQIQEGLPTLVRLAACAEANFPANTENYGFSSHSLLSLGYGGLAPGAEGFVTLVREDLDIQPCPLSGQHNLSGLYLAGETQACQQFGFNRIGFACHRPEQMQFYRDCPIDPDTSSYYCLGGWEEPLSLGASESMLDERRQQLLVEEEEEEEAVRYGYIVAKPEIRNSKSNRRVCFVYSVVNDTYSWTVGKTGCLRNVLPGLEGTHRFNSSLMGPCLATGISSSFSNRSSCPSWSLSLILVLYLIIRQPG